jgi:epidermal growth factor receptor substrate 15
MPTSLIPIIARTNTIDEWRIQTNKSATDLNDLGFYTYDKTQGTLVLSNTSILNITANGTPLQVANNVLFQSSLTLGNTLFLGVQSSATGNIVAGGTISVRGPGSALSVSNSAYIGTDLQVVNNVYTSNITSNNNLTVENNLNIISGKLRLNGTGNVAYINSGSVFSNTLYAIDVASTNVRTSNLYALYAKVDTLGELSFASILTLESSSISSTELVSNTHSSNNISTRYLTANISGNIVNFTSNVSSINTATVLVGNVVTLTSNSSTLNVSSINTATIIAGNVVSLISDSSALNVATINSSTTLVGNVVTLTSNLSSINVASINTASINVLSSYNLTSTHRITANNIVTNNISSTTIDASRVNVSSNLWMQSGSHTRIYAPNNDYESLTVDGKTTLRTALITNNLTVQGTWTALGDIEYETNDIILNKRTPTNADASITNERPVGDDAIIRWSESEDQWVISKGNTYSDLYAILDSSLLNSTVTSISTSNIATPLAVNTAHRTALTSGSYANSAYTHANAAFVWANSVSTTSNANSATLTAGLTVAGSYANSAYRHANASFVLANTVNANSTNAGIYANSAFAAANAAAISGGIVSGGYANAAFSVANSAAVNANSASIYANGAFVAANTAAVSAAQALDVASSASSYSNASFSRANTANSLAIIADSKAVSAGSYANSAYSLANTAIVEVKLNQTITGNLSISGEVSSKDLRFQPGTVLLQGSKVVLNGNQNQNQSPSLNAVIEVDRGTSANSIIRYNEVSDKWEFSHDGVNFSVLNGSTDLATSLSGGAANRIVYQSGSSSTAFIDAPVTANYFLKWTGSAFTWSEVPSVDLSSANIDASRLTSGVVPTARLSGTYNINILGNANFATTAGSATTASSATTATNATNVTLGGTVVTGSEGLSATTYGIRNYGHTRLDERVFIVHNGTTTSKNDPSNLASLKILGDIAVSNDVWATIFRGVATSARYADLAEKYLPDQNYPVGTLLMIGGEKEVTAAIDSKMNSVIGIVSENPAYLMNSALEGGVNVALKGRIPVRVKGVCSKGDLLTISDEPGIMVVSENNGMPIRIIALENKQDSGEGLIEAALL